MEEKNKSSSWRLALIHFLIAGFCIPLVVRAVTLYGLSVLQATSGLAGNRLFLFLLYVITVITYDVFPLWLGIVISAKTLRKRFQRDKSRVLNLSVGCFILFNFIVWVASSFLLRSNTGNFVFWLLTFPMLVYRNSLAVALSIYSIPGVIVSFSIMVFTFYILSRKYIKGP